VPGKKSEQQEVQSEYPPPSLNSKQNPKMATPAKDIASSPNRIERTVSHSLSVSTSPTATFHSPTSSFGGVQLTRRKTGAQPPKPLKPFDTQDIKILLLENVNQSGKDILAAQGYQVEALKTSLPEDQLIERIRYAKRVRS
jgi:D-3-phosphoglycerate dehydrogenase